jgi:membrane fusion protein, multidrug efflux system
MKKSTKIILIIVILGVIGILFIYPRLGFFQKENPTSAGGASGPGGGQAQDLPVNVVELRAQKLENNLNITGTVIPNEMVVLRPEISGLVSKITFNEGQFVKKGTPLVYLNDEELKAQFQRLKYSQKLFESQENRQKQLLSREAISQEEYDIVLNQFNTNLSDLKLIEAQLSKTVIRAPFDGVVGLRQISEGSVIGGNDIIASIINIDPIKIEFSIPERYANAVKPGSKIFFSNDNQDLKYEGTVYAFEPSIDAATRTLKLRATSSNKDRKFLPGMFVRIKYVLGVEQDALLVPAEAVIPELSGYKVFVVNAQNQAEERKIEIGVRTDTQVQIVSGVKPGELVLTTGVLQARTGMPVVYKKIN